MTSSAIFIGWIIGSYCNMCRLGRMKTTILYFIKHRFRFWCNIFRFVLPTNLDSFTTTWVCKALGDSVTFFTKNTIRTIASP